MKSRYAAYAVGNAGYIMHTTHPQSPHCMPDRGAWERQLLHFCRGTTFEKLSVLSSEEQETVAHVTFRAQLRQGGDDVSFVERSRFGKIDGRWFYIDRVPS